MLVCDEVGYIPFDPQAASLMFMLVSRRYERASMIVTSNKPFSAWGEIFGDDMAATAMVDRLIHHAEILSLKGDCYRLKDRDLGPRPGRQSVETGLTDTPRHTSPSAAERLTTRRSLPGTRRKRLKRPSPLQASPYGLGLSDDGRFVLTRPQRGVNSQPAPRGQFSTGLDIWEGWPIPESARRWPTFGVPRSARIAARSFFLFRGALSEAEIWGEPAAAGIWGLPEFSLGGTPAFVWPSDHAWCVAADVDPHWAGVGATVATIERLLSDRRLDAVATDPDSEQPAYR